MYKKKLPLESSGTPILYIENARSLKETHRILTCVFKPKHASGWQAKFKILACEELHQFLWHNTP
jgi:hypothetical protein